MAANERCRTAALGGHVARCEDCAYTTIAYNSCHPEARRGSANRFGDVRRRQVPVMALDHARIGVAEIARHHRQRHAVHDRERGPGMAKCKASKNYTADFVSLEETYLVPTIGNK